MIHENEQLQYMDTYKKEKLSLFYELRCHVLNFSMLK